MQSKKRSQASGAHRPKARAKPKSSRPRRSSAPAAAEEIRYRPRRPSDDDFIVQLARKELGRVHEQAFGEPFPEEELRQYLQSGVPTVVIERGNQPVGFYSYLPSAEGKVHVSALVVDPKVQRTGIGRRAMEKLEADARQQGAHTLEVFIQDMNEPSIAFAKKLGFREITRFEPRTIVMWKSIAPAPSIPAPLMVF